MSKAKRKYTRSAKWQAEQARRKAGWRKLTEPGPVTAATGNHNLAVRIVTPGSDEDLVDRAERAEDSARMMGHKYECLRLLILEALGRK
jgi:hypothetical protein